MFTWIVLAQPPVVVTPQPNVAPEAAPSVAPEVAPVAGQAPPPPAEHAPTPEAVVLALEAALVAGQLEALAPHVPPGGIRHIEDRGEALPAIMKLPGSRLPDVVAHLRARAAAEGKALVGLGPPICEAMPNRTAPWAKAARPGIETCCRTQRPAPLPATIALDALCSAVAADGRRVVTEVAFSIR